MASCKDTSTFFSKGNCSQFEHVLKLYPQCLKLRAEKRAKKPEELVKLDNWYQNELPVLIKSRGKDAHLIHDELVQTMKWKQTRGKFYPQLSYLVKVNTPRAVMVETKKAFKKLPNLEQAMTALCNLKGVGTTMASALLAAAAPEIAPFMADECLSAIPDIEGIDYTTKRYLIFVQHIHSVVDRLNKEGRNGSSWSHHQVELALWTHFVANEMKPELLDDLPGFENGAQRHGNGAAKEGVDSDSSQEPANGKHLDALEDSTTSFNDDSVDKADFLGTDSADKADSVGTDSADKPDTDVSAKPAPGAEDDAVARDCDLGVGTNGAAKTDVANGAAVETNSGVDSTSLEVDLAPVGVALTPLEVDSKSVGADSTPLGAELTPLGVDSTSPAVGIDSTDAKVDSTTSAVEVTAPGIETAASEVDSTSLTVDSAPMAVDSAPIAVESTPAAVESSEEAEPTAKRARTESDK